MLQNIACIWMLSLLFLFVYTMNRRIFFGALLVPEKNYKYYYIEKEGRSRLQKGWAVISLVVRTVPNAAFLYMCPFCKRA
jgi:hypothetical protein